MDSTEGLSIGQVVISKAGRDAKKSFIIYEVLDDKHVLLVDGKLRKVEQAKKKKVKHLMKTNMISKFVQRKLSQGDKLTNAMIRKELEMLSSGE